MSITFEEIAKEWADYKKSDQSIEVKQAIFNKAKLHPDNMWAVCFSEDKSMYKELDIIDCQAKANKSLDNIKSLDNPPKVLLDTVASTCLAYCQYKDDINYGKFNEEKMNIWLDTICAYFPQFKQSLEEEIQWTLDSREKIRQQYASKKPTTKPEVIETITLSVPLVFTAQETATNTIPHDTLFDIVEHYNVFRLDTYMKLKYVTSNTKLKIDNNIGYFSFDFIEPILDNDRLDFLEILKKSLAGQLSDGWGESFRGQLIENDVIYTHFDSQKVEVCPHNPAKKMKIK